MSRDWTPREQHFADKRFKLSDRKIEMVYGNQKEIISDPTCELAKTYPNMYFLCLNILKAYQSEIEKIALLEACLDRLIKEDDSAKKIDYWNQEEPVFLEINGKTIDVTDVMKNVSLWYCGRLDDNFYYNEYNNELFVQYIGKMEIDEVENEKDDYER